MIKLHRLLIGFLLIISSSAFSQKSKKADRALAENIQAHINSLGNPEARGTAAEGERFADNYLIGQLKKNGCQPMGDSNSWTQKFNIAAGKKIGKLSSLSINGKSLALERDFFPFAFSGSSQVEATVIMALAEPGEFVDLKDLLDDNDDSARIKDTSYIVSARARRAESKGATALVVYNNSIIRDISFNGLDTIREAKIPVVYISNPGVKKYFGRNPSSLDVKMNIVINNRFLDGTNIIGYQDNHARQSVMITAQPDNKNDVAALLELSRLLKARAYRSFNYLYIIYSAENKGAEGTNYFNQHPVINLQQVNYTLDLDKMQEKGAPAVKQGVVAINALKGK